MDFVLNTINGVSSDQKKIIETQPLQNKPHSYSVINRLCCVGVCSTNKLAGIAVFEMIVGMITLSFGVLKSDLPIVVRIILGVVGALLLGLGCGCGCYHRIYRAYRHQ